MAKKVATPKAKKGSSKSAAKSATRKPSGKTASARSAAAPRTQSSPRGLASLVRQVIEASAGILRLAPTWVPRSFLMPGKRLKLAPQDLYALGAHRGGIDERWFGSTTPAANEGAPEDEGLSYVVHEGKRVFTLREAIALEGPTIIGPSLWERYHRWPVYSKFFDNLGPIPHHMHQNNAQAALVGQQGKPESYYFPPQLNAVGNNFPYTFFGLEPGTTKQDIIDCLARWNQGDNGILNYSKAYRLQPGTGWLVPPCILHAPGSLVTYEPQWGSDVFAMYQSMVEGREVPWSLLVKDVPPDKHHDLEYLVDQLDWEGNVDPNFKDHHYLEPIDVADTRSEGWVDRWVVYGKINGEELFSAKELTIQPGVKTVIRDNGAYGLITVQGSGWIGKTRLQTPAMIRFGELTEDEVFVTYEAARQGIVFDNTGSEPLVTLRYFGPDTNPNAPEVGDHKRFAVHVISDLVKRIGNSDTATARQLENCLHEHEPTIKPTGRFAVALANRKVDRIDESLACLGVKHLSGGRTVPGRQHPQVALVRFGNRIFQFFAFNQRFRHGILGVVLGSLIRLGVQICRRD